MIRRTNAASALAAALVLAFAAQVRAQPSVYPTKPIRIVAPAAAGSGTDLIARMVGQQFQGSMGQLVVVENRVGAGGSLGMESVAKSPPDGYTLLLSTDATIAIQPQFGKTPFDATRDLTPIGEISSFVLVVVVRGDNGVRNLSDLARAANARSGGLSYGMGGKATGGHIVGETIRQALRAPMTAVTYPSAARAVTDLLGGHVEFAVSDVLSVLPHVQSGALRAIAVAGDVRARCLPEAATLKEQGIPFDIPYSYGLLAPPQTPPAIVEKLSRELRAALATSAVKERLAADCQQAAPAANSPEDFAASVRYHATQWGRFIREAGIQVE